MRAALVLAQLDISKGLTVLRIKVKTLMTMTARTLKFSDWGVRFRGRSLPVFIVDKGVVPLCHCDDRSVVNRTQIARSMQADLDFLIQGRLGKNDLIDPGCPKTRVC